MKADDGRLFPWCGGGGPDALPAAEFDTMMVDLSQLKPGERLILNDSDLADDPWKEPTPWPQQLGNPFDLIPRIVVDGSPLPLRSVEPTSTSRVHLAWRLIWSDGEHVATVFATCWRASAVIDWSLEIVFGTTATAAQFETRRQIRIETKKPNVVRWARHLGGTCSPDKDGWIEWVVQRQPHPTANDWQNAHHRAARFMVRGELHTTDSIDGLYHLADEAVSIQPLAEDLDGHLLSMGDVAQVPDYKPWKLRQLALSDQELLPWLAGYWSERLFVQPIWSETTGEQSGFGATSAPLLVGGAAMQQIMLRSCEAYGMRPTGNREPNGQPVSARYHPNARTENQTFGRTWSAEDAADRCGWPLSMRPIEPQGLGVGSEAEHRDAVSLHVTAMLTADEHLLSIVADHVELAAMDQWMKWGWIYAPRAVGRLLLDWAGQLWLGFGQALRQIERMVQILQPIHDVRTAASMRDGSDGYPFFAGGLGPAAYGWNAPDGKPIIGMQPWQQALAMIGFQAAARVVRVEQLRKLLLDWARGCALFCVRHGFEDGFEDDGNGFSHVYARDWNAGTWDPTKRILAHDAERWTLAAARALRDDPGPDGDRARRLLAHYGPPRVTMSNPLVQAQFWAVPPLPAS